MSFPLLLGQNFAKMKVDAYRKEVEKERGGRRGGKVKKPIASHGWLYLPYAEPLKVDIGCIIPSES